MAHFTAARHFNPQVDFILDIGGQDIKCFKVKNGSIDSIMLNEACSSGCGSFIETFARSMGYEIAEFSQKGLFSKHPVDLGSRCTVFMNSSVKQAQKDGAGVEDISAGLSISVVKNAIYKVIRAHSAKELGQHIVVQGGTFLNDAVLRSFERELGGDVIRPAIAGLMGAYGAALYGKGLRLSKSTLLTAEELENFTHTARSINCSGCTNHCALTINTFAGGQAVHLRQPVREAPGPQGRRRSSPTSTSSSVRPDQGPSAGKGQAGENRPALGPQYVSRICPSGSRFLTELGFEVVRVAGVHPWTSTPRDSTPSLRIRCAIPPRWSTATSRR